MRKYYLYGLFDPNLKTPKYIGITNNVPKRFEDHLRDNSVTKKTKWIKSLKEGGQLPKIKILKETDDVYLVIEWEKLYIEKLSKKYNLTNSTSGGEYYGIGTPILVFDLEGNYLETYNSMIEYAELLGRENYSDISAVCLRKRNYACDRIFRYLGDTVTDEDLKKLKEALHNRDEKKVYIYSIDGNILGKFNSIQEASKAGFGNSASISGVLNNKEGYITVKGNFACSSPRDYKVKLQRYMKGKSPIQCYSLDGKHEKTFYKIADAVKYCNCTSRTSIRCCLNGTQYKAYNHLWRYSWDSSDLKI